VSQAAVAPKVYLGRLNQAQLVHRNENLAIPAHQLGDLGQKVFLGGMGLKIQLGHPKAPGYQAASRAIHARMCWGLRGFQGRRTKAGCLDGNRVDRCRRLLAVYLLFRLLLPPPSCLRYLV
jgi:hypothetical protein